jgi:hypothetical protein
MSEHPRLWWTADRSELVEDGDARAAVLAYGPADPVDAAHEQLIKKAPPAAAPAPAPEPAPRRATRKVKP